jgi:hypothetical protein
MPTERTEVPSDEDGFRTQEFDAVITGKSSRVTLYKKGADRVTIECEALDDDFDIAGAEELVRLLNAAIVKAKTW